jgi:hypothetical protein
VKAKTIRGTRFLHILAPFPPGWKTSDRGVRAKTHPVSYA